MSFLEKFEAKPKKTPLTDQEVSTITTSLLLMYESLFLEKDDDYKRSAMCRVTKNAKPFLCDIVTELRSYTEIVVNGDDIETLVKAICGQKLQEIPDAEIVENMVNRYGDGSGTDYESVSF